MQNLSDRALKERIIGAVVLVVFAVLVVPIFLDGPSDDPDIVSQTVTLPGQDAQERTQQTIILDRDREQPVPATRTPEPVQRQPVAADPQPKDDVVVETREEAPATAPPPQPEPEPEPATESSSTGMWAVQLGSFSNQENAERLAADLREEGFAAFLSQVRTDGGQLHRVRIGPQNDRDSAEEIAAQLQRSGHTGQVVPHP